MINIIVRREIHKLIVPAGDDYVGLISYLLTFDSSNVIDVIPLAIIDDEADENTEILSASISFPGLRLQRVFLEPNITMVEIHDNDCELVFS